MKNIWLNFIILNNYCNFRQKLDIIMYDEFLRHSLACRDLYGGASATNQKTKQLNETMLPTGSVKVECSPPERKVVSSSHSRVISI